MFLETSMLNVVIIHFLDLLSVKCEVLNQMSILRLSSFAVVSSIQLFSLTSPFIVLLFFTMSLSTRECRYSRVNNTRISRTSHWNKYTELERLESYCRQLLCTNWCMMGFTARAAVFLSKNIIAIQERTTPDVCTADSLSGHLSLTHLVTERC